MMSATKWFAPFGFVRYADEHGRTWGSPGAPATIPTLREGASSKARVLRPGLSEVIEGITSIEARYPGLEDFMIHWGRGVCRRPSSPSSCNGSPAR